jgi:hypothetical protein
LAEEAVTTSNTATNMDLPAVLEGLVRWLASSLEEAATTTSNILATTITDHQAVRADLQAWPTHSWEVAARLAVINLVELSTVRTRTTATVEAAVHMVAATSNTVEAASNTMDLTKITVAAVVAASWVAWWVATSRTAALAAMAIHQEEDPAVPTLALRHQARTSLRDSPTTALLVNTASLVNTIHLGKATALTLVRHLKVLHRRLALTTRPEEPRHTDNNLTVDRHKADMEDTSSQVLTAALLSSMVAMTKVVMAAREVLVATDSNRWTTASPKVGMADSNLLLAATAVVDTNSSTETADTEDDLLSRTFLVIENVTCSLRRRKLDDCIWKRARAWLDAFWTSLVWQRRKMIITIAYVDILDARTVMWLGCVMSKCLSVRYTSVLSTSHSKSGTW